MTRTTIEQLRQPNSKKMDIHIQYLGGKRIQEVKQAFKKFLLVSLEDLRAYFPYKAIIGHHEKKQSKKNKEEFMERKNICICW